MKTVADLDRRTANMVLSELLNKLFMTDPFLVGVQSPVTLTTKDRKGDYRKRPFIGGESFSTASCYLGKRGIPILVFRPGVPKEYAFVEATLDECPKVFGVEFTEKLEKLMNGHDDKFSSTVMKRIQAIDEEERKNAVLSAAAHQSPEFATW